MPGARAVDQNADTGRVDSLSRSPCATIWDFLVASQTVFQVNFQAVVRHTQRACGRSWGKSEDGNPEEADQSALGEACAL